MSKRASRKRRAKKPEIIEPADRSPAWWRIDPETRREVWPAIVWLILASAAAFGPGLGGGLLNWDDNRFIQDNELIRTISLSSVGEILAAPHFEAYQPLHLLSYLPDYQLFHLWAPGYKIHSFLLWSLDLVLLLLLQCPR